MKHEIQATTAIRMIESEVRRTNDVTQLEAELKQAQQGIVDLESGLAVYRQRVTDLTEKLDAAHNARAEMLRSALSEIGISFPDGVEICETRAECGKLQSLWCELPEPVVAEPAAEADSAPITESVIEPVVIEPSVIEPVVIEPSVIEPVVIEPSVIEPVVIEPSVIEPVVETASSNDWPASDVHHAPVAEPDQAQNDAQ